MEFLSLPNSVFLFFFIGIDSTSIISSRLVSVFQEDLLSNTSVVKHWAGRNSRGVAQFIGKGINKLLKKQNLDINLYKAKEYLEILIKM